VLRKTPPDSDGELARVTCCRCKVIRAARERPKKLKKIKPIYRATFRAPKKGPLNPSGFRFRGEVYVEIREGRGGTFRFYNMRGDEIKELGTSIGILSAKASAESHFAEQVSPWRMFHEGRELVGHEYRIEGQEVFLLEQPPAEPGKVEPKQYERKL
jgi:hypothetical protein